MHTGSACDPRAIFYNAIVGSAGSPALKFEVSSGIRPAQHAERSKGVPAARLAGAAFHLEVHRTRMRILERPTPVFVALLPHQIDCLGDALVGCDAGPSQVVQSPQDVVVPARGERNLGPCRSPPVLRSVPMICPVDRDRNRRRSRRILLSAKASGGDVGPRTLRRLVLQQPFEHADRRVE